MEIWSQFVFKDALAYVALYLTIRSGDWDLKMASIKLMAPIFSAYDHSTYSKLIARHISDVLSLPTSILNSFKEGCFVVSFTGKAWHSIGVDEAHEMGINKDCKTCIVRPTKDYINRIANYIPHRSKCLKNLQRQTFQEDEENNDKSTPKSYTSKISSDKKSNSNIQAQISSLKSSGLLSLEGKVFRVATGKTPTPQQEHNLLNFREIGKEVFDHYVNYSILRKPSVKAPQGKRKLATLSDKKPTRSRLSKVEKDLKLVQKCLHKKLKWSKNHKSQWM